MKTTCRQAMVIKDWYSARISDSIIVTTYRHSDGTKCLGADCGKEQAAAPTLGHPGCKNPEWGRGVNLRFSPISKKWLCGLQTWNEATQFIIVEHCPGCGLPLTPPEEPLPACRLCGYKPVQAADGSLWCTSSKCSAVRVSWTRADWIKLMGPR